MRVANRTAVALADDRCADAHNQAAAWASIAELTRAALEGTSVSDLVRAAVHLIGREMAYVDYVCVGQITPTGLRRIAAFGVPDEVAVMLAPDPPTFVAMRSAPVGEGIVIPDWDTEVRRFERAWLQLGCIKSSAFMPIRTYPRGTVFGFLGMHANHAREFLDQDIVYLEIVANVLGEAVAREQALQVAAEHVEQFRALAEHSPDMISRFDHDLRMNYVNGTVERLTGLSASKLVGRTLRDMRISERQVCALELALRQVLRTGIQCTLDFEAATVLGPRTFQTYIAPELDLDGKIRSVVLAARDITQHDRVLAQLDELRELIERLTATHRQQIQTVAAEGQLTPRERQILNLIARGWSNREIAGELGVSRGNVKNQVSRLLNKLDVSDRTQAATQAVRLGLVEEQ